MDKKIAIVTGANKGIGYETVKNLAQKGLRVYLGARDEKRGTEAAHALKAEGLDVEFLYLDVTNDESVKQAAKKIEAKDGRLDVLVNNAGVYLMGQDGKASEATIQSMIDTYQVNVFGVMRVTQGFLPLLKKAKNASVVMVSSGLASITLHKDPASGFSAFHAIAYNSSKSALNGVMIGFSNELKEFGINVNSVNPGYNSTDLNANQGTHPPSHGGALVAKAAFLDGNGPTGTFVDEKADCPW